MDGGPEVRDIVHGAVIKTIPKKKKCKKAKWLFEEALQIVVKRNPRILTKIIADMTAKVNEKAVK